MIVIQEAVKTLRVVQSGRGAYRMNSRINEATMTGSMNSEVFLTLMIELVGSIAFMIVLPAKFALSTIVLLPPTKIEKVVSLTGPVLVSLITQLEPPIMEMETEPLMLFCRMLNVELSPPTKLNVLLPLIGLPVTMLKVASRKPVATKRVEAFPPERLKVSLLPVPTKLNEAAPLVIRVAFPTN